MLDAKDALGRTLGAQRTALQWFESHRGQTVPWKEIQAFSAQESRLVNQAKGIYKPAYTEYALSVRTIQDGPYPDKDVEFRSDGSWVLHYFQENPDYSQRDREATNRGLVKCLTDGVPVGALIKRAASPQVAYEVLGLGLVVDWEEGFFTIEGFSYAGRARERRESDAARLRATQAITSEPFDAENDADLREKILKQIAKRRGQGAFRAALLNAYGGACCVTGCDVRGALEAAHIAPHRGDHSQHVQNGLLLRCDIHTLFDLGLLVVTDDYHVKLDRVAITHDEYAALDGKGLRLPDNEAYHPSIDALRRHREWASI